MKIIIFIVGLMLSTLITAQTTSLMYQFIQEADHCQDLSCARNNLDAIDNKIVILLGQRLAYVRKMKQLKVNADIPLHNQNLEMETLARVGREAERVGYSGLIARAVFTIILGQSNFFEQRVLQQ